MFKSVILTILFIAPLLLTQCKSTAGSTQEATVQTNEIPQDMEMRNPAFAKAITTYHKWSAGVKEGGSGIAMQFGWNAMPENVVMRDAYFRGMTASIQQNQKGYSAHFTTGQKGTKDIIMHSDPEQEAVNTPPVQKIKFPTALTETQVGIIYEENGQLVYTIIQNSMEQPEVALPQAPPSGGLH